MNGQEVFPSRAASSMTSRARLRSSLAVFTQFRNKLNSAASARRDRTQDESIAIEGRLDVAQLEGSTSQHSPRHLIKAVKL